MQLMRCLGWYVVWWALLWAGAKWAGATPSGSDTSPETDVGRIVREALHRTVAQRFSGTIAFEKRFWGPKTGGVGVLEVSGDPGRAGPMDIAEIRARIASVLAPPEEGAFPKNSVLRYGLDIGEEGALRMDIASTGAGVHTIWGRNAENVWWLYYVPLSTVFTVVGAPPEDDARGPVVAMRLHGPEAEYYESVFVHQGLTRDRYRPDWSNFDVSRVVRIGEDQMVFPMRLGDVTRFVLLSRFDGERWVARAVLTEAAGYRSTQVFDGYAESGGALIPRRVGWVAERLDAAGNVRVAERYDYRVTRMATASGEFGARFDLPAPGDEGFEGLRSVVDCSGGAHDVYLFGRDGALSPVPRDESARDAG